MPKVSHFCCACGCILKSASALWPAAVSTLRAAAGAAWRASDCAVSVPPPRHCSNPIGGGSSSWIGGGGGGSARVSTWTSEGSPALAPPYHPHSCHPTEPRHRRRLRPALSGRAAGSCREGSQSSPQSAEVARHLNLRCASQPRRRRWSARGRARACGRLTEGLLLARLCSTPTRL